MENEMVNKQASALMTAPVGSDDFQPMEQDSIRLPRLILVQGGNNNAMIRDGVAKEGDLINSLSKDNYGSQLEVVPLFQMPNTRIKWLPRDSGGGIACIARDGKMGHGDPNGTGTDKDVVGDQSCMSCQFYSNRDQATGCTSNYQMLAIVRSTKEPIMLTGDMMKSADRGIKDMLSLAVIAFQSQGIRMFQRSYMLTSTPAQQKQFHYFKLMCRLGNDNKPLPPEEIAMFEQQYNYFKGTKVETSTEEAGVEAVPKDW